MARLLPGNIKFVTHPRKSVNIEKQILRKLNSGERFLTHDLLVQGIHNEGRLGKTTEVARRLRRRGRSPWTLWPPRAPQRRSQRQPRRNRSWRWGRTFSRPHRRRLQPTRLRPSRLPRQRRIPFSRSARRPPRPPRERAASVPRPWRIDSGPCTCSATRRAWRA